MENQAKQLKKRKLKKNLLILALSVPGMALSATGGLWVDKVINLEARDRAYAKDTLRRIESCPTCQTDPDEVFSKFEQRSIQEHQLMHSKLKAEAEHILRQDAREM